MANSLANTAYLTFVLKVLAFGFSSGTGVVPQELSQYLILQTLGDYYNNVLAAFWKPVTYKNRPNIS